MYQAVPSFRESGHLATRCQGHSLVECTLILSFISLMSIVLMSVLGVEPHGVYSSLKSGVELVRDVL